MYICNDTLMQNIPCPKCGSDNIRTIVNAFINFKSEQEIEEFNKKSILGRDVIDENSRAFHCDACGLDFGTVTAK